MNIPKGYIPMKQSDIKILREKIWLENDRKCPILDIEIPFEDTQLDHQHKTNNEEFSPEKGVIRTQMDFRCNQILGKLENSIKRTGLQNREDFDLPTFLRNQANYFEAGQYIDENGNYYCHPSEIQPEPKLKKSSYNKLKKLYSGKRKFPDYPKSGKITLPLKKIYEEYNLEPEFYKR